MYLTGVFTSTINDVKSLSAGGVNLYYRQNNSDLFNHVVVLLKIQKQIVGLSEISCWCLFYKPEVKPYGLLLFDEPFLKYLASKVDKKY